MAPKKRSAPSRPQPGARPRVQRRPATPGGAGLAAAPAEPLAPAPDIDAEESAAVSEVVLPAAADEPSTPAPAPRSVPSAAGSARRVGRIGPGAAAPRQKAGRPASAAAAVTANLDPDDASIPLASVPYAAADLRRVGVIATVMTILIVIAAIIVNTSVH